MTYMMMCDLKASPSGLAIAAWEVVQETGPRHTLSGAKYQIQEVCTPLDEEMGHTMFMFNTFH